MEFKKIENILLNVILKSNIRYVIIIITIE